MVKFLIGKAKRERLMGVLIVGGEREDEGGGGGDGGPAAFQVDWITASYGYAMG